MKTAVFRKGCAELKSIRAAAHLKVMQWEMILSKVTISRPKLFGAFLIICLISTYLFTSKLIDHDLGFNKIVSSINIQTLIGFVIGLILPAISTIFALGIVFQIPRFVEITEDEISYKLCLDRDWKRISWRDIGGYREISSGVKLSTHDKDIVLNLWMFTKKDRITISKLISNKM